MYHHSYGLILISLDGQSKASERVIQVCLPCFIGICAQRNHLSSLPRVVVVYKRNTITNAILESKGLRLIKISGSELVRGRGGPRCMSMPFVREAI